MLENLKKVIKNDKAYNAFVDALPELEKIGMNNVLRTAHLIAQCRHESMDFERIEENLNYSATRLYQVFPKYFASRAEAQQFHYNPEKIANRVYGNRMGNDGVSDGWNYRGRGYLQLTGKDNYRIYGDLLDVDLINFPDLLLQDLKLSWLVAAHYFNMKKVQGKTLFEWADLNDTKNVSFGVNGGYNGIDGRIEVTKETVDALSGLWSIYELQRILTEKGYKPGLVDGLDGPKTQRALKEALKDHEVTTQLELQEIWS